jgi:hypothetical protein
MKQLSMLALALTMTACAAPTQQAAVAPPEPAFDPVGVYDFTTQAEGDVINGTITIRRDEEGRLTALISTPVTGSLSVQNATLEGRRMDMRSSVDGQPLLMRIDFVDDRITGGWELGTGMSGSLTGRKRGG